MRWLATVSGLPRSTVHDLIRGRQAQPTLEQASRLAAAIGWRLTITPESWAKAILGRDQG